jgi:signal transduction histidine kinase
MASDDLAHACEAMVEEARAYHPDRQIHLHTLQRVATQFDRSRMEQVISNLIGNAIKHGDPLTPVTVTLAPEGGSVSLRVHNQGPPIDAAAKARIFNPMVRNLQDGEVEYGAGAGLGLGLYIAAAIVTAHNGKIEVDSSLDDGTTFTVTLPNVTEATD